MRRKELSTILKEFEQDMRNIFKDDFRMVRLYGSYARGDYNQNSDIAVMVLVNIPHGTSGSMFGEKGIFEMYSVPTALYICLSSFFLYIKIHIGEAKQCTKKEHLYSNLKTVPGDISPRQ